MVISEEPSYTCKVLVFVMIEKRKFITIIIHRHTSELQYVERLSPQSYTLLLEECWSSVLPSNGQIAYDE